jgi:hypothetical protein
MSTYEQTHQVIIGGDFNEEITNINTTTRQQYVAGEFRLINSVGNQIISVLAIDRYQWSY